MSSSSNEILLVVMVWGVQVVITSITRGGGRFFIFLFPVARNVGLAILTCIYSLRSLTKKKKKNRCTRLSRTPEEQATIIIINIARTTIESLTRRLSDIFIASVLAPWCMTYYRIVLKLILSVLRRRTHLTQLYFVANTCTSRLTSYLLRSRWMMISSFSFNILNNCM